MSLAEIVKNELGYWELKNKPSLEELEKFYNDHYFDSKNFEVKYSEQELKHKNVAFVEAEYFSLVEKGAFLDIGCGEGFSLNFFSKKGWCVTGIDFSSDGVARQFPNEVKNLRVGDIYIELKKLINEGKKFDLVTCNNVLEHLLDPIEFLDLFKDLLTEKGRARVQVPNDYSYLQEKAGSLGLAESFFWYAPHEHMSYFTQESLVNIVKHCGLKPVEVLGDFPIDFFLFHENSNYLLNSSNGKGCHKARMTLDLMMLEQSVEKLVNFRVGCGKSGLGRNAIIYFSKESL